MQRYGDRVAVMHSRLSQGEKYDEWRKMATQQVRIAIGARSAIFAPFTKIGLIIVDEEHESSYKQEESPKYHARDVALQRGLHHGATVVFGSATPSLESYFHAHKNLLQLLDMPSRVNGQPLPNVSVVDMRHELREGNRSMFSGLLREAITRRLERGEQSVLLLNRRGYASFVLCRSCGFTVQCPHCEITLTYHLTSRHSRCHYCGYSEREVHACPSCGSEHIRHFGAGTQRVEEELTKLFPGIRSIRMDVDTTTAKGSHEKLLSTFRDRKADVLLGTQMIAKGLDFPHVTLVGVISADTMLRLPDFRATERTFQLLTQVSGRAGRHQLLGEVIVQTYTPEHYSIQYAANHDYRGFARKELLVRKELGYPPYRKLALATLSHDDLSRLVKVSDAFAKAMKQRLAESSDVDTELLGPVPSPIPKLKDRYRFQCVVKYREETKVREMLREITDGFLDEIRKTSLGIQIDIEPQVLL
jgi:primosomal protein N' (replication factor Y)